jgi:Ca2+-binding RTX toxin-like protein
MEHSATKLALVVCAGLLVGCPGGTSTPSDDSSPSDDSGPASWSVDSGSIWSTDSGVAAWSEASTIPAEGGASANGCPHGNLMAAIPTLPVLCRPFPPTQAGPPPQDPPECQTAPQQTLTADADTFVGQGSVKDHISGMEGSDVLKGMECGDVLNGNQGADWIHGNMGADKLYGGQGQDTIHGGAGHDEIWGGGGDDAIWGGGGDDTFYYAEGNGNDVIQESAGHDTIHCTEIYGNPRAQLVGWSRAGDDLVLSMSGGGSITVKGYYTSADNAVETITGCQ